jgi:hypothetical protein
MREVGCFTILVMIWLVAMATAAGAQDAGAINGNWVASDTEAGEIYYAAFDGEGRVTIDIFSVQYGYFVYDEQQHRLAIVEEEDEREAVEDDTWVGVRIQGDRLTVTADDEESVVLDRVSHPAKPVSALVGRWRVNAEQSSPEVVGEERELQMFMTFNNDGTASYEELQESLKGAFKLDPQKGSIELSINEETELGTYQIAGDQLTISFADETHVFTRAKSAD